MTTNDSTQKTTKTQNPNKRTPLAIALTKVYDDFSEVMALNYFFYDAMDALYRESNDGGNLQRSHFGLVLFLGYLKMREEALSVQLLQVKKLGEMYKEV